MVYTMERGSLAIQAHPGESILGRFASEDFGGAGPGRGKLAGTGESIWGELPVGMEDFLAAAANGSDREGGAAVWAGPQGHGGGGKPSAFLDLSAARVDVGRVAAAAPEDDAVTSQHRAALGGAPGPPTAAQKKSLHAQEQDRPENRERREAWQEQSQLMDPRQWVFVDERGATTQMTRRYGRAPRGERVREATPRRSLAHPHATGGDDHARHARQHDGGVSHRRRLCPVRACWTGRG